MTPTLAGLLVAVGSPPLAAINWHSFFFLLFASIACSAARSRATSSTSWLPALGS